MAPSAGHDIPMLQLFFDNGLLLFLISYSLSLQELPWHGAK
jgi:hypothetical protein